MTKTTTVGQPEVVSLNGTVVEDNGKARIVRVEIGCTGFYVAIRGQRKATFATLRDAKLYCGM